MAGQFIARLAGVAGIVFGSQAPGFTGQYMQNLTGRVDELAVVVEKYDAIVEDLGVTREGYVDDLRAAGRESTDKTAVVVEDTYARYEDLLLHQKVLESAEPWRRPLVLARGSKADVVESTASQFDWSIPLTAEGAGYALGGGTVIWGSLAFVFGLVGSMFGMGDRRYA